jgi:hypothetical protein
VVVFLVKAIIYIAVTNLTTDDPVCCRSMNNLKVQDAASRQVIAPLCQNDCILKRCRQYIAMTSTLNIYKKHCSHAYKSTKLLHILLFYSLGKKLKL